MNKDRYITPDLGRGLMLLLIAIAHAPVYHVINDGINEPTMLDRLLGLLVLIFVDGRAFVMFSLLFGFGIALSIQRQQEKGISVYESKILLRRRSLFMLLFGFIHLVFIGGVDIIGFYGLAGLLIGGLLFKSDEFKKKALIIIGLFSILTISLGWWYFSSFMNEQASQHSAYLMKILENSFVFPIMIIIQLLLYPFLFVILIGILVMKKSWISQPEEHKMTLKKIASIGISISIIGALPLALATLELWNLSEGIKSIFMIFHILSGVAGGLGYTSLIALFSISAPKSVPNITKWLTAVGKRSLTFYLYQEALLVLLLSPVAFGLGGKLRFTEIIIVALFVWLSGVIFASLLERREMQGPADALLRKLVYRK